VVRDGACTVLLGNEGTMRSADRSENMSSDSA
jgi:hypothetical protein